MAYQGVEFDSATAKVEVIGKSINVTLLELVREDGRMKLDGSYLGTDLVFTVESDLKPEILVALGGKSVPVPEELKIPEKATLRVHGRLDIPEGKPVEPTLVRARIKAENLAWNKVPVKTADLEVEYRPNQLFVQNCRIELEKGKFELFANGFLDGQMFVMGQSTVPLDTIDKLMAMKDDDFFMERFAFHGNSGINLSFQGTLGLYNLEKAYDIEAVVSVANTKYKGVEIKSARRGRPPGDGPAGPDQRGADGLQLRLSFLRRIVRRSGGQFPEGQKHRLPFWSRTPWRFWAWKGRPIRPIRCACSRTTPRRCSGNSSSRAP